MRILAAAAFVALAACRGGEGAARASAVVGAPVPEYATITLAGDSISLSALRGDVVLLNLWATWCHPCRDEIPVLQELHTRYEKEGLRVVGVSLDVIADAATIRTFLRDFGVTYPIWRDPGERSTQLFLAIGVPTTLLISRDGVLLWRHTGPVRRDDRVLTQLIERALEDT